MLTIGSVSFHYRGVRALEEVSVAGAPGKLIALVGRNGSGKSTLLRLAAGLLSSTRGSVRWSGLDLRTLSPQQRARSISYVSQRPQLSIALSVVESIRLGLFSAQSDGLARQRVTDSCVELGLDGLADRPFHELSAGEQQRCLIARALVQHRSGGLLVLDEPFSNLDPAEASRVARVLRARALGGGLVLVAMHDLTLADQIADHVWLLERGALLASGPPSQVLTTSRLCEVFSCEFARGPHGITLCALADRAR